MIALNQLNNTQVAAAARLFSSSVFQEMAKTGRSPTFARLLQELKPNCAIERDASVGTFFDSAFELLQEKSNRYEYIYKSAITHKILLGIHSLRTSSMLTEFRIRNCKADVVILNGTSTVYEIKTDKDSLDRLESQIDAYRQVFSRVNVITGDSHLNNVLNNTPNAVGVLLLNSRSQISTIREAKNTLEAFDPCAVFESLHRREAISILQQLNINAPDVPNTQFHAAMLDVYSKLDPTALHGAMLTTLKKSRSLSTLSDLIQALPKSLQTLAISTPLRKQDHVRLLNTIQTPISTALCWT